MHVDLVNKIKARQEALDISLYNLVKLLDMPIEEVERFFNAEHVLTETIENITDLLGLDILGNELITIQTLKEKRAEKRALYVVSLVQDTMSLEMQGLELDAINTLLEETKEQFLTGDYQDKLWST